MEVNVEHRFAQYNISTSFLNISLRFELDEPVGGLDGTSFTLEDVPKKNIEIVNSEGRLELSKEFRLVEFLWDQFLSIKI